MKSFLVSLFPVRLLLVKPFLVSLLAVRLLLVKPFLASLLPVKSLLVKPFLVSLLPVRSLLVKSFLVSLFPVRSLPVQPFLASLLPVTSLPASLSLTSSNPLLVKSRLVDRSGRARGNALRAVHRICIDPRMPQRGRAAVCPASSASSAPHPHLPYQGFERPDQRPDLGSKTAHNLTPGPCRTVRLHRHFRHKYRLFLPDPDARAAPQARPACPVRQPANGYGERHPGRARCWRRWWPCCRLRTARCQIGRRSLDGGQSLERSQWPLPPAPQEGQGRRA